jgi:hypothetical protein
VCLGCIGPAAAAAAGAVCLSAFTVWVFRSPARAALLSFLPCLLSPQPVVPLSVNGRQLAPDELAVCDLCDSDDEGGAGPKWEVRKRQAVEVEDD